MATIALLSPVLVLAVLLLPHVAMAEMPGGWRKQPLATDDDKNNNSNDMELVDLAVFAIEEHNSRQNSDIKFVRLVSAEQQVVAGIMHHLHFEAESGEETSLYEAKVWVKAWEKFKSLMDFKRTESSLTPSDLGTKSDDSTSNSIESRAVSSHDPAVKEAAEEALKDLQSKSNSLIPYELKEVVSALAQVTEEVTNIDLLFKTQRGSREEQFLAKLSRTPVGAWTVKAVHAQH